MLSTYFSCDSGYNNSVIPERVELTRTPVLVEGCDYEHWFVVMEAPKGYPLRDEIVDTYIKTLAMTLGSEKEAKKSIYSVSTKYYYAFALLPVACCCSLYNISPPSPSPSPFNLIADCRHGSNHGGGYGFSGCDMLQLHDYRRGSETQRFESHQRQLTLTPHLVGGKTGIQMEPLSSVVQKLIGRRFSTHPSSSIRMLSTYFSCDSGYNNSVIPERVELTRTPVLVEGCDYEHWFVVMEAPKGYPLRDEIFDTYIKTLAMALGSEEEAKKSIYSVSTKYYYAFGCKIPEDLAFRIKSLPNVKWVLPDSYIDGQGDNSYGGEPFIDGKVVPYDNKYHSDWIQTRNDDGSKETARPEKASGKQRKQ
ncbi:hypothetical protein GQ457_09G005220 [Hibiscus cannabinus]